MALLAAATTVAAILAGLFLFVLSGLSKPADAQDRLDGLEQQQRRLNAMLGRRQGDPDAYPTTAVCAEPLERADDAMRQLIASDARTAGVDLSSLEFAPGEPVDGVMTLTPIAVRLSAKGPYDGIIALVSLLGKAEPQIFVDAVDLRSRVSSVDLKLSGRVFCSASARL